MGEVDNGIMNSGYDGAADGHAAMISRIENARFSTTRLHVGYDELEVDKFLDLLVETLSGGGSLDPQLVRDARFATTRLRPGYSQPDVDALLEEVEQYASEYR
jgi:DivIVA domain-containing protein